MNRQPDKVGTEFQESRSQSPTPHQVYLFPRFGSTRMLNIPYETGKLHNTMPKATEAHRHRISVFGNLKVDWIKDLVCSDCDA